METSVLTVGFGERIFAYNDFDKAISKLEKKFGYEGDAWDEVIATNDFEELCNFLIDDGLDAEFIR